MTAAIPFPCPLSVSTSSTAPGHRNGRAGDNGGTVDLEEDRDYMAKNTLRFSKGIVNRDGTDESPQIMLSPADYPIEKTEPSDQALILHDPDAFWA